MSCCYLCGQNMIDRPIDYELSKSKYSECAIKHEEHIIQNALHGRLTNCDILCERCGSKLSSEIDTDFCKIFEGITEQLKPILASKDHGNNKLIKSLKGYVFKEDGTQVNILVKAGKVVPKIPYYEHISKENKVKIFVTKTVAKDYKIKVEKELTENGIDISSLIFENVDDISYMGNLGINFSENIDKFDEKFKLGLNKIATGFAIANGIDRTQLPNTLDINAKKIIYTSNCLPYCPFTAIDTAIESLRSIIERKYPTHTLILFTDCSFEKNKLVCYIDLFSTFQFYVILNDDFKGDNIQKIYYQTVLKQVKPELNIRDTKMSELSIVADSLGISLKELEGKDIETIYKILEVKHKQMTASYSLNLEENVDQFYNSVSTYLLLFKSGNSNCLSELEKEIFESIPIFEARDELILLEELKKIEDGKFFYRQNYVDIDNNFESSWYSTLYKMIETSNVNIDIMKSYGHFKFYLLSQFIQECNRITKNEI